MHTTNHANEAMTSFSYFERLLGRPVATYADLYLHTCLYMLWDLMQYRLGKTGLVTPPFEGAALPVVGGHN